MPPIIKVPLEEGGSVLVELQDGAGGQTSAEGATRSWRPSEALITTTATLEEALEGLGPATRALVARLKALADAPSEIGVEFGVKLNAEAGVIIARTSGEANFKVSLQWSAR